MSKNMARVKLREENIAIDVAITSETKPHINDQIRSKWQRSVNTLAAIMKVPSALIMQISQESIEVFIRAAREDNPFIEGAIESLGNGLYCETAIGRDELFHLPSALESESWKNNPDISLDMVSYLGIPLKWPDGEVFGTICVLDTKAHEYEKPYVELLQDYKAMIEADMQRELYVKELEKIGEDTELRMREIHHRIKNHFAVIGQLIQFNSIKGKGTTQEILADVETKLKTVALLHEQIYKDLDMNVTINDYVREVAQTTIDISDKDIKLTTDFQVVPEIEQKHMLDFGLVTSEIVTNSIKYGLSDDGGSEINIALTIYVDEEGMYRFEIRDNGKGFPEALIEGKTKGGIGTMMIESFVKSHQGRVERFNDNGAVTRCIIRP